MNSIRIFCDVGVSFRSFVLLEKLLARLFPHRPIHHISAAELMNPHWLNQTYMLVFPGGRDQPYQEKLAGPSNDHIRSFVDQGGIYLGICAGAYYAARDVEFEKGTPMEIIEKRELGFYPGTAKGTLYHHKHFSYENESGAHSSLIRTSQGNFYAYYNGGCGFLPTRPHQHYEVLATYDDLDQSTLPAIVRCFFGKGFAILSGVHFEFSPSFLQNSPITMGIGEKVASTFPIMNHFLSRLFSIKNEIRNGESLEVLL